MKGLHEWTLSFMHEHSRWLIKKTNELDFELTEEYCKRYGEREGGRGGRAIPNVTIIVWIVSKVNAEGFCW